MPEDAENEFALRVRTNSSSASAVSIPISFQSEEDDRVDIDNDDYLEDEADDIHSEEAYQEARSSMMRRRR